MFKHFRCVTLSICVTVLSPGLLSVHVVAQTFKVLYTFHGPNGALPLGQLTLDNVGNVYGTTGDGGNGSCVQGCGTVFAINKGGKLLGSYSFNGADGAGPDGGLSQDSKGNFLGTTQIGGNYNQNCGGDSGEGCGVLFKLTPKGKETLYKFTGAGPHFPSGDLVQDASGNIYGTTLASGRSAGGTVYKLDQTGKLIVLQKYPSVICTIHGLIMVGDNLYGSVDGSPNACERQYIFQMTTTGSYTDIGFGLVTSILTADTAGNFYGATRYGGVGYGTVFKISPNDIGGWTQTTLYKFCQQAPQCKDGEFPTDGPLALDSTGNIYGTTEFGGTSQNCSGASCGVVYKLDPSGNETVIYNFTGGGSGAFPHSGLTMDSAGNLYGATTNGGDPDCPIQSPNGCGVVFKITP